MEYLELAMNRRQFLSSVASLGVSAALPAKAVPIPETISPIDELEAWNRYILQRIMATKEYWRAYEEQLLYGRCVINVDKVLAEIEALDSRREPWHDLNAGDVPVQE